MATRDPSTGMAHLTVVPENFEPAVDGEAARGDGVDERIANGGADERADGDERADSDERAGGND